MLLQLGGVGHSKAKKPNRIRVDAAMDAMLRNMCAANALAGGGEVKSRFVAAGEPITLSSLDAVEPVTACPLNRASREKHHDRRR